MSQTKAQLLDNIKDNVQLDARNSLRFADTDSSHYVAFKAPATVSSNVTWTLPAADGSANYVLATDGSGTLSWIADPAGQWVTSSSDIYFTGGNVGIGDSSPSNPLSVTGASVFNGDLTLTGASYNVVWDKSDNALEFADNAKAAFGTGSDLNIYHNGTDSIISNTTGDFNVTTTGAQRFNVTGDFVVNVKAGTEDGLKVKTDGAVELYNNNSKKFETYSGGTTTTGDTRSTGGFYQRLADGTDRFSFTHDGANCYLENQIGSFYVKTVDNTNTFEISNSTVRLPQDSDKLTFGAGNDLEIYHDGNNSKITDSGTGILAIGGSAIHIEAADHGETMAKFIDDGAVELYYDNSKKIETTSAGLNIHEATDKVLSFSGGIGEIGSVPGFQGLNTAGSALTSIGMRGTDIRFATGSAERLRIASSGQLLINTTTVSGYDNRMLTVNNPNAACYIEVRSDSDEQGGIIFSDGSAASAVSYPGYLAYNHTTDHMLFVTATSERMRIDSAGRIGIGKTPASYHSNNKAVITGDGGYAIMGRGDNTLILSQNHYYDSSDVGKYIATGEASFYVQVDGIHRFLTAGSGSADANVTLSEKVRIQNGGGISFNGDTAAANALDDYEEGTWTPVDTDGNVGLSISGAYYTKIGRMVYARISQLTFSSNSDSSSITIGGLPYTINSNAYASGGGHLNNDAQAYKVLGSAGNNYFWVYPNGSINGSTWSQVSGSIMYGIMLIYEAGL